MKKYQNFILEFIRNEKNVKWYIRKLLIEIRDLNFEDFHLQKKIEDREVWELNITTTEEFELQSEKIIENYQRKLLKSETYLYYSKHYSNETKLIDGDFLDFKVVENGKKYVDFHLYIKDVHINRIKPSHFVYHTASNKNRESILKNGLEINENINFKDSPSLNHPPMIFATMNKPQWKNGSKETDTWQIDTTKINNKWWLDPNMHLSYNGEDMITTFENIHPDSITLYESF